MYPKRMGLSVSVTIGAISVMAESDAPYPDAAQDLTNRVRELLHDAVEQCHSAGWNPMTNTEEIQALTDWDEDA